MGFLEKVKNMFTEEVEEEENVKVEKVDKVKKEIISSFSEKKEEIEDFALEKEQPEESKPVFLDDNAFSDLDFGSDDEFDEEKKEDRLPIQKSREDKYIRKGNYKDSLKESFSKKEEPEEEKKIFKPTPIISPVYGVLDKNYHKEDIVSKSDIRNEDSSEQMIDRVRNKAYGTLEDELESTLFGKNSVLFSTEDNKEEKDVDTKDLDELTDDISKELDELLLKKEKKNTKKKEKSVETKDDDLLDFIDSTLYKEEDEDK